MAAIFITLGNHTELGSEEGSHPDCPDRLVVRKYVGHGSAMNPGPMYASLDLGSFTKKRIEELQGYLERLKVHADD